MSQKISCSQIFVRLTKAANKARMMSGQSKDFRLWSNAQSLFGKKVKHAGRNIAAGLVQIQTKLGQNTNW